MNGSTNAPSRELPSTTFDRLWDEAVENPGHTAMGRLPDGWDGEVSCAVQVNEEEGAVVLDAPADRLVTAIASALNEREWYVERRYAARLSGPDSPMRYMMSVRKRTRV